MLEFTPKLASSKSIRLSMAVSETVILEIKLSRYRNLASDLKHDMQLTNTRKQAEISSFVKLERSPTRTLISKKETIISVYTDVLSFQFSS